MASELQRIAQGLVECLDEIPEVVGQLQQTAAQMRQHASAVASLGRNHPEGNDAALQLDAAARKCEQAAEIAAKAPPAARAWAQAMVDSPTRAVRPDATTDRRPTGQELVEEKGDRKSDLAAARRTFYKRVDDVVDVSAKWAETGQDVFGPPAPTYAETRSPPVITEQPREGIDAGNAATAMLVVAILIGEFIRWLRRRRLETKGR